MSTRSRAGRRIHQLVGDADVAIAHGTGQIAARKGIPIRTGNSSARCAATAASTAERGEANAAHTPSPVCLNNQPPCASIAARNTPSWAASATRIPSASFSHRRVEPSTSVNKNVTTPAGTAAAGADTPAESHTRHTPASHIGGIRPRHPRPEALRSALPGGRIAAAATARNRRREVTCRSAWSGSAWAQP